MKNYVTSHDPLVCAGCDGFNDLAVGPSPAFDSNFCQRCVDVCAAELRKVLYPRNQQNGERR